MLVPRSKIDPEQNPLLSYSRRYHLPVNGTARSAIHYADQRRAVYARCMRCFSSRVGGILFAMDSVPAIFAITREPLIVFTSNVFAILGLRSLYFLLAAAVERRALEVTS